MRIGVLTTHPIQYQAPWFRRLSAENGIDLTVFFCMIPNPEQQGYEFGERFQWDIPLLDGYDYEVLENVSPHPAVTTFSGCDTPGIERVVREGSFDAFIVNGWLVKSCIQLIRACNRHDVPCIVRGESNDLRRRPLWKRLIHRILLRRYDAFLYIGEGNRRFYRNNGVPEERLFFAPYCVDNERFAAAAGEHRAGRGEIRSDWGIAERATVFLFSGKFIPKKRPLDLLEALRLAGGTSDSPPMHVLMTGSGELLEACRASAARHELPLSFTGFLNQSEIPRAYAAADCLVLPSDAGETWGLVVNEAMASGLVAIVSDHVGCHEDLIIEGETGHVFPLGDVGRLAELMTGMASSPDRLESLGREAKERVMTTYNYETVVEGTMEALRYVASR